MHHYTYTCGKESDEEFTYLPYQLEVTVKLPAGEMWKEIETSFTDYKKGWMWATQFSQPRVDDLPLRSGVSLYLDYQVPNLKDPSAPPIDLVYDYDLAEWNQEEKFCRYEGKGRHPFRGGGFIDVDAVDENTCLLKWGGKYRYKTGDKSVEGVAKGAVRYFYTFLMAIVENIEKKTGE